MAAKARAAFGGLLSGFGAGLVSQVEQRRQDALEKARELARTRERQEDRDFSAQQNALTRDQQQAQFDTTNDMQQAQLDQQGVQFRANNSIEQARLKLQQDQATLAAQQIRSALDAAEQAAQVTGFEVERLQELKELRAAALAAETPAEQDAALRSYQIALTGKPEQDSYTFGTAYGEENEMGVQTRQSGSFNPRTGEFTPILPSGVTPASGAAAQLTPEEIQGLDLELMADPSPENRADYDRIMGAGASNRRLGGSRNGLDAPLNTSPGAAPGIVAPSAAAAPQPEEDLLAGFRLPEARPRTGLQGSRPAGTDTSAPRGRAAQEQARATVGNDRAAYEVMPLLAAGDLTWINSAGAESKIRRALASDKLSEEHKRVLQAVLNRKK